ncbi:transporter [Novimethylophilus kurashikiensis]|uniref:Transporter n=1 Tax=Novimethylophilus kurashikiensis TaxID=1825523 RepID=A0A2R5F4M9_9PROT|nr:TolC family protein [Novimethylophilus kurashikiensis]GBG13352.1 transporter [Novimethylophilus kurashikiensis]
MKTLIFAAVLLPLHAWSAEVLPGSPQSSLVPGATVQELLQWADANNPELTAMGYEVEAASQRIQPAGALPDPVLRAEIQDFAGRDAPNGFNPLPNKAGSTKYTFMQSIPLWGKRGLKEEVATAELDQAKGRKLSSAAEIHAKIKSAYAQLYQATGMKALNDELAGLYDRLEAVAQVRYASGLVPQQDVIRAQVEKTSLRSEAIALEAEQQQARARLNAVLGRPQGAPLAEPKMLEKGIPAKLEAATLQQRVMDRNPWLSSQTAQISAAEANRRLVEKNRYPDVTLGIAPIQRGTSIASWEAMIEVNIPLRQDTRRSQEGEANALLLAAQQRQQAMANQIMGEVGENLAAWQAANRQEQLTANTLLPQAQLTFQSALAGYETGKVDFATLLDAQRAIKRAKQDILKAQVEQAQRLAEIEKMAGEE